MPVAPRRIVTAALAAVGAHVIGLLEEAVLLPVHRGVEPYRERGCRAAEQERSRAFVTAAAGIVVVVRRRC
jgi:hypothetical protein